MFYKNNIFVMPMFWFGFASAFGGQTLYEPIMYQWYNMAFTAFPIMWFAMFDEEFTKRSFLHEPRHYWIGLCNKQFNLKLISLAILKGIFTGLLIFLFVFESLNGNQIGPDGVNDSLWLSSSTLYAIVVIDANLWIL